MYQFVPCVSDILCLKIQGVKLIEVTNGNKPNIPHLTLTFQVHRRPNAGWKTQRGHQELMFGSSKCLSVEGEVKNNTEYLVAWPH